MRAAKMTERPSFQLMVQTDVQSIYHMQMPRWLFSDPRYCEMALDAKVTYTFLLNRFQLSRRNGWVNERGEVFVIFPRKALAKELRICEQRVTAAFKKLVELELVWEKRCGRGDANQIYPAYTSAPFTAPEEDRGSRTADPAPLDGAGDGASAQEPQDLRPKSREMCDCRTAEIEAAEPQNRTPSKKEKREIDRSQIKVSPSCSAHARDGLTDEEREEDFLDILDECELSCFPLETALVFENAIERLYYADSYRIGNATLPQSRVRAKLRRLDGMILREVEHKLRENREENVKNSTAYITAVLFNCIAEGEGDLLMKEETPMLLSDQQKYIISVLKQVKYIRLRQLYALTVRHYRKERFEISQHRMDVMLRQLRTGTNFVYFQEDVVCYGKRAVDERYLEAVDVMLELTYCEPEFFSCERLEPPRLLRFTGQTGKLSFLHTVAWMDTPYRIMAIQRMKGERLIWISDRSNGYGIELPRHHILAVRQEDGTHRFFGSQEPEKI